MLLLPPPNSVARRSSTAADSDVVSSQPPELRWLEALTPKKVIARAKATAPTTKIRRKR